MIDGDKLVISDKLIILIVFFWKAPFSILGTFDPSAVWRTGHKAGVQFLQYPKGRFVFLAH